MVEWPPSVPTGWLVDDASMSLGQGWIGTDMDAGPARRDARPRQPDELRVSVVMTKAQSATFSAWYRDALLNGTIKFQATNQFTGEVYWFEFVSVSLTVATPGHYRYDLEMIGARI